MKSEIVTFLFEIFALECLVLAVIMKFAVYESIDIKHKSRIVKIGMVVAAITLITAILKYSN